MRIFFGFMEQTKDGDYSNGLVPAQPETATANGRANKHPFGLDRGTVRSLDRKAQIELIKHRFSGAGWQIDRFLDGLDKASDDDYYYERLGQIRAPRYSKGRVVLLGDAGYAASPMSGQGTVLSFVGAYILAGEMAKAFATAEEQGGRGQPDIGGENEIYRQAFAAYQTKMEPFVKKVQALFPGAPGIMLPESDRGVKLRQWLVWGLALVMKPMAYVLDLLPTWAAGDGIELPDYSKYEVERS